MSMQILAPERSVISSVFANHIQLYFTSRADFAAWRPTELFFRLHSGFASDGMGVVELLNDLIRAFLKFF